MPVKYSIVKDLDCRNNRLNPGSKIRVQRTAAWWAWVDSNINPADLSVMLNALRLTPTRGVRYRKTGGAGRDRTGDLLNANQALSQLSYSPLNLCFPSLAASGFELVGLGRFELPTSPLSGVRSSQLSYRPSHPPLRAGFKLVELVGIEPATS